MSRLDSASLPPQTSSDQDLFPVPITDVGIRRRSVLLCWWKSGMARGDPADGEWESIEPFLPVGERGPYPQRPDAPWQ